jgi:hypothetical protein
MEIEKLLMGINFYCFVCYFGFSVELINFVIYICYKLEVIL